MDKDGQVMPSFDAMTTTSYTPKQWLQYYRNIWVRNEIGSLTDVMHDSLADGSAQTGDMLTHANGQPVIDESDPKNPKPVMMTYAHRMEQRKANARRAAGIVVAIDALLALSDEALAAAMLADSDFLKEVEVKNGVEQAAPADKPSLVSFTVQKGMTMKTEDGVVHNEGETVDLDPEADQTKQFVTNGVVAPTTANV